MFWRYMSCGVLILKTHPHIQTRKLVYFFQYLSFRHCSCPLPYLWYIQHPGELGWVACMLHHRVKVKGQRSMSTMVMRQKVRTTETHKPFLRLYT